MKPLLTPEQVAELLSMKVGTIYAWRKEGRLPHVVVSEGKRKDCVRFHPDEIETFLRKRHRKARDNRSGDTKRPQESKEKPNE